MRTANQTPCVPYGSTLQSSERRPDTAQHNQDARRPSGVAPTPNPSSDTTPDNTTAPDYKNHTGIRRVCCVQRRPGTRRAWKKRRSHGQGEFGERCRQTERWWDVGGEFVVAAAEVLHGQLHHSSDTFRSPPRMGQSAAG